MNQRIALLIVALGLLLAGWMDGTDHAMAQKYAANQQGRVIAKIQFNGYSQ